MTVLGWIWEEAVIPRRSSPEAYFDKFLQLTFEAIIKIFSALEDSLGVLQVQHSD